MVKFAVEVSEKIQIFKCEFASYPAFSEETAFVERYFSDRSLNLDARIPGAAC